MLDGLVGATVKALAEHGFANPDSQEVYGMAFLQERL
jgi:hypothetical protein